MLSLFLSRLEFVLFCILMVIMVIMECTSAAISSLDYAGTPNGRPQRRGQRQIRWLGSTRSSTGTTGRIALLLLLWLIVSARMNNDDDDNLRFPTGTARAFSFSHSSRRRRNDDSFLLRRTFCNGLWFPTLLQYSVASSSSSSEDPSTANVNDSNSNSNQNSHQQQSTVSNNIPRHVAFICDGNSRWAAAAAAAAAPANDQQQQNHHVNNINNNNNNNNNKNGFKTLSLSYQGGHWKGAERLLDLLELLQTEDGIEYCTVYGFSTENWSRPHHEIQDIFKVMEHTAQILFSRSTSTLSSIRLRILGDLEDDRIPFGLRTILRQLQTLTDRQAKQQEQKKHSLTVCLAINYGGRHDILQASQQMAAAVATGQLSPEEMTEETLSSYLCTAGIPDPDLIVRTGGEHRLSNFMLWNAAYSELYITDVLWPDFDTDCWHEALRWYQQRSRRFGSRTNHQLVEGQEERPTVDNNAVDPSNADVEAPSDSAMKELNGNERSNR